VNAGAFVVGPEDAVSAALFPLAQQVGMAPVMRYSGLAKAEKQLSETPLVFFLCAAVSDIKTLKPMADAIRFSPSRRIRFSPLIYFAHSPSVEVIRACINMGFDDIVAALCRAGGPAGRAALHVLRDVQLFRPRPAWSDRGRPWRPATGRRRAVPAHRDHADLRDGHRRHQGRSAGRTLARMPRPPWVSRRRPML
jgi:hypothetical protein